MKSALCRFRTMTRMGAVTAWAICLVLFSQSALSDAPADSPQMQAEKLMDQLDDADPAVRRAAGIRLSGLPGAALPAIEAALNRDDLSPESRLQLKAALKLLGPRAINDPKS